MKTSTWVLITSCRRERRLLDDFGEEGDPLAHEEGVDLEHQLVHQAIVKKLRGQLGATAEPDALAVLVAELSDHVQPTPRIGGTLPGVDLDDSAALLDIIEGRR